MGLKFISGKIGERYYEYALNKIVVYCTLKKDFPKVTVNFIVGRPGATLSMSKYEFAKYHLGIEACITAHTENHPDFVSIKLCENDAKFKEFYTNNGSLIKEIVTHRNKQYMFDGTDYYEISSNANSVSMESVESFIAKNIFHKYQPSDDVIFKKKNYQKLFLEIFQFLR